MTTIPTTVVSENPARDDLERAPHPSPLGTPGTPDAPGTPGTRRRSRLWALSGAAAAVSGLAAVLLTATAGGVYDPAISGEADQVLRAVNGDHAALLTFHVLAAAAAMLLVPFALGLARRLRAGLDERGTTDSLAPGIAAAGLLLTAGILVMGSGLDTEFILGPHEPGTVVAENVAMYNHWVGTIPWLWTGAGLAGVSVAVSALRHRALPRWIGVVGLLLGGLTLVLGVSPLAYMAGLVGPVWLLVTAVGLLIGDRAHRD